MCNQRKQSQKVKRQKERLLVIECECRQSGENQKQGKNQVFRGERVLHLLQLFLSVYKKLSFDVFCTENSSKWAESCPNIFHREISISLCCWKQLSSSRTPSLALLMRSCKIAMISAEERKTFFYALVIFHYERSISGWLAYQALILQTSFLGASGALGFVSSSRGNFYSSNRLVNEEM